MPVSSDLLAQLVAYMIHCQISKCVSPVSLEFSAPSCLIPHDMQPHAGAPKHEPLNSIFKQRFLERNILASLVCTTCSSPGNSFFVGNLPGSWGFKPRYMNPTRPCYLCLSRHDLVC